jgi:hypothetical protein
MRPAAAAPDNFWPERMWVHEARREGKILQFDDDSGAVSKALRMVDAWRAIVLASFLMGSNFSVEREDVEIWYNSLRDGRKGEVQRRG